VARKRKQGGADGFVDAVALLPWWGGVALAVVSYLVLHQLSVAFKPAPLQPGQVGKLVQGALIAGFASVGQFIVPVLCLVAAAVSFIKRRTREALVDNVTHSRSADSLNMMSWGEFEMLVGEAFRLQGFSVTENGGGGPDGGVDLVLRRGNETFLVQCKQWRALKVGVGVVRELYGVMAAQGAAGGFVVTSGSYTPDALEFASGRHIMLIDDVKLFGLIRQAKASLAKGGKAMAQQVATSAPPQCPTCSAAMVHRTAQKGGNAGSKFWGCSRFPACRGTR
jgi:restriction system protein